MMDPSQKVLLTIDGHVGQPLSLTLEDLRQIDPASQVDDVGQLVPGRKGTAVRLEALLKLARVDAEAKYLGLHASADDFHVSIPLSSVEQRGLVVYRLGDLPLPQSQGGPIRFLIPDPAACRTAEVDECASVKFVDRLELTLAKGFDSRPQTEQQHAKLHESSPHLTDQ